MGIINLHCDDIKVLFLLIIFYISNISSIFLNIFEPFAPEQGITVKQNNNDLLNATDDALVTQYQTTQTNVLNAILTLKRVCVHCIIY